MLYDSRKSEGKIKNNNKNIMISVLILAIVINSILLINLFSNYVGDTGEIVTYQYIDSINSILSLIAVGCASVYYLIYKEEDMFFIIQVYIVIAIDLILSLCFKKLYQVTEDKLSTYFILLYVYRVILILLMINKKNKLSRWMINDKKRFTIISVAISIILFLAGKFFEFDKSNILNSINAITLSFICLIYYIYAICKMIIKGISTNNFIYSVIVLSISMLNMRNVYKIGYNYFMEDSVFLFTSFLTFLSFIVLILGLFLVLAERVKESRVIEKDLWIFHDIIENNKNSNILIFSDSNEVLYMNKRMLDTIKNEEWLNKFDKADILKKLVESNYLDENTKRTIIPEIAKKREYFGKIKLVDGRIFEVNIFTRKFDDICYSVLISFDITHESQAIEKLVINEKKLSGITDNITELIATFDLNGIIRYMNNSALELLKVNFNELQGTYYKDLLVDEHEFIYNFIGNEEEESTLVLHKIRYENRPIVEVESIVKKLLDEGGEVKGYIVVSRHTKMKKELEKIKLKYNEIKQYDKIKTEFFGNLSHEVRTPINIIHSCLQLLNIESEKSNEALAEYYKKYENTIRQNCFRILRLVNNIIDISTFEWGFNRTNFVNGDIIKLVEDITMSVIPYVNEKKINIMFDTDTEELNIVFDPDLIEKVMLNLISNAVKFTNENGEILVDIRVDEEWVNIRVKDSGIGIPNELHEAIFERFIQVDKSFNRKKEGSGIGLALVKSIVQSHFGMIKVESSSSKGTVFLVQLPNRTMEGGVVLDRNAMIDQNEYNEKVGIEFSDIYKI